MSNETVNKLSSLISLSAKKRFLKKAIFSKSGDKNIKKAVATLFSKGENLFLQIEYFTADNKAIHKNLDVENVAQIADAAMGFSQINLIGDGADAEYKRSKNNTETIIGEKKFSSALENYGKKIEIKAHNRAKAYAFDGSEPFMFELGIADKNGRV